MISFEHIEYAWFFFLVPVIVILFFLDVGHKKKVKKEIGDPRMIDLLTKNFSPKNYRLRIIFFTIAVALSIVAAINPRLPEKGKGEIMAGIDVMIALDVSNSMLCNDIKPTRLDRAKQLATLLTEKLENNRVGLVVFAGQAILQMPLTPDIGQAKMYISNASVNNVPVQGTDIADALQQSDKAMDTKEKKYKSIVLISDGEDHEKNAESMAKKLNDDGVIIYTVGIGTAAGGPIPDPVTNSFKTDENGQTVITKLNAAALESIARAANGRYMQLENPEEDANLISGELNSMEKKEMLSNNGYKTYFSFYPFFLAPALILLIISLFIPETKKSVV
ncbi:MAG: VWA domain-containing protein [Chitinophagaceae bacterium]